MTQFRDVVRKSVEDDNDVVGCQTQITELQELAQRFVSNREGTSVLLIGERGTGKSMVLNKVLDEIENQVMIVRLNGFLHTTDRSALKEFAHQIKTELDDQFDSSGMSYAECFGKLLKSTALGERQLFVFVLDEFDLFAQRTNQILLYLLLDATRLVGVAPVLVIGVTCRHEADGLLEKRVLSRLSNRKILFKHQIDSFEEYLSLIIKRLSVSLTALSIMQKLAKEWNNNAMTVFESAEVIDCIQRVFDRDNSVAGLRQITSVIVALSKDSAPFFTAQTVIEASGALYPVTDGYEVLIDGLTLLELCLLVCIQKSNREIYGGSFNFELIVKNFMCFANKYCKMMTSYNKQVLLKALERLMTIGLIAPTSDGSRMLQDSFRPMTLQVDDDSLTAAAKNYRPLPVGIRHWIDNDKSFF
uniref:Origin recognition complex subunit 4 n=1 Tax=Plectus sambesii TaxID=2011161 RepID=A0A914WSI6_9BILA